MELQTRLVFIDTCAYESKNFQFGQHALGRLQELVENEKIHLLITDVTRSEIEAHLHKKSDDAASKIKQLTKDAMFLRNTPELDCHGIFTKVDGEEIYRLIHNKFLEFVENEFVETISVGTVNPEVVFYAYFNNLPPFNKESKKHEFPDAFVLEAIKEISVARGLSIYIVSSDGDMESFCNGVDNFIYLNSVDKLIDLTLRSDTAHEEPTKFADEIFEQLKEQIIADALQTLEGSEFSYEEADPYDEVIDSVKIDSITITNRNLQDVDAEHAEYILEFEVTITADYLFPDYERSPWDYEDKHYAFVLKNELTLKHQETYTAYVTLVYDDGLRANAHIAELNFEDSYFELTNHSTEVLHSKELDLNGE